jgi:hypothetical protein
MENVIVSENKRPRGRPKVFDSSQTAMVQQIYPDLKTNRSLQNRMYMVRAMNLLRDSSDCKWLLDRENHVIRQTILAELGRIDQDEDLLTMARKVCELRPKARDAILIIRTWRKSKRAVTQPAGEEYCKERWGFSRPRAYQLIEAAKINQNLSTLVDKPTSERQTLPLAHLEPEQQEEEARKREEPKQEIADQAKEDQGIIWDYFAPHRKSNNVW